MAQRPIDVQGSEIVSTALLQLLNQFPALDGKQIQFSTLGDTSGIGFFPTSGSAILTRRESITGHVSMQCAYPFNIIYRAAARSETQKLAIKEWLDTLGKWVERQPIIVNGETVQLMEYPELDEGRIITSIYRNSPGHLSAAYQDGVEDWLVSIVLRYKYDYGIETVVPPVPATVIGLLDDSKALTSNSEWLVAPIE